jgi:hypothetical protein
MSTHGQYTLCLEATPLPLDGKRVQVDPTSLERRHNAIASNWVYDDRLVQLKSLVLFVVFQIETLKLQAVSSLQTLSRNEATRASYDQYDSKSAPLNGLDFIDGCKP